MLYTSYTLAMNLFLLTFRGVIDSFVEAYGFFHDTRAPVIELMINIIVSCIGGYYYGIAGVLLGTFLSVLIIVILYRVNSIYKYFFKKSTNNYLSDIIKSFIPIVLVVYINDHVVLFFDYDVGNSFEWILLTLKNGMSIFVLLMFLFLFNLKEFESIVKKVKLIF